MKRRTLLLSITMLALALATFAGATFALFTDNVTLNTHLQAGNLQVTLARTSLETKVLNADGLLETKTYTDPVDFTSASTRNFFEVDSNTLIVPGTMFNAGVAITNSANVAFNYYVEITIRRNACIESSSAFVAICFSEKYLVIRGSRIVRFNYKFDLKCIIEPVCKAFSTAFSSSLGASRGSIDQGEFRNIHTVDGYAVLKSIAFVFWQKVKCLSTAERGSVVKVVIVGLFGGLLRRLLCGLCGRGTVICSRGCYVTA